MSIEVLPNGIKCNLQCTYCYQDPMRNAGNYDSKNPDVERMLRSLDEAGHSFTIFGGEALLTPIETLERLFELGLRKYGSNGVQTNGTLITEKHFQLFKKYNVQVGMSIDGPEELNDLRWTGNLIKTRMNSKKSCNNLYRLLEEGYQVSLIVTIHGLNASKYALPKLKDWFRLLASKGLTWVRLHLLEVDSKEVDQYVLSEDEAFKAIIELQEMESGLSIDMFSDIPRLMKGDDFSPTCIWGGCDPFKTEAVHGINSDGSLSNCGRTNKDGTNWVKAKKSGNEREFALKLTPQEFGGCAGCKYWEICKGECPGQSKDWRIRTNHCSLLKRIFAYYEDRVGYNPKIRVSNQEHGDHYDYAGPIQLEVR